MRGRLKDFDQRNVQVLAVLPETVEELLPSVQSASGDPAFPVLSDIAVTVSATYGQGGYGSGVDPATFIIDRDEVIRFQHRAGIDCSKRPVFDRPDADRLLAVLDGLDEKRKLVEPLTKHSKREIREAISLALGSGRHNTQSAVAAMCRALADQDVEVRRGAAAALWYLAPRDEAAVLALNKALEDRDPKVRMLAVETLWAAGRKAKSAVPALVRSLADKDAGVRSAAADTLWVVAPDAKAAIKALADSVHDDSAAANAAFALSRIGHAATAAQEALIEMLRHNNGRVRELASAALKKIDPEAAKKAGVR